MDIKVMYFLLSFSVLLALVVFVFTRKMLPSFFALSLFGNISIYLMILVESMIFMVYNLQWLRIFSLKIWPIINIIILAILVYNFAKNKLKNKNEKEK